MGSLIIGNGGDIRELVESMFHTREEPDEPPTPEEEAERALREESEIVLL